LSSCQFFAVIHQEGKEAGGNDAVNVRVVLARKEDDWTKKGLVNACESSPHPAC